MRALLFLITLVGFSSVQAQSVTNTRMLDQLAADFFAGELGSGSQLTLMSRDPRCQPQDPDGDGSSCADVSCGLLGRFGCDDISEIERVGRACRGNWDGSCVRESCARLGNFGCDDIGEVERVAAMCRGNRSGACIEAACVRLGNFGCDDFSELERVSRACQGVRAACLESVCQRLGNFGCDDISEIERVGSSCRGN